MSFITLFTQGQEREAAVGKIILPHTNLIPHETSYKYEVVFRIKVNEVILTINQNTKISGPVSYSKNK